MAGTKLIDLMQKVAKTPLANATDLLFGVVTNTTPLTVRVENRFEIGSEFIILTSAVSDFNTTIIDGGVSKVITVKQALTVGEKVILLRVQDGQRFLIIDRTR